MIKKIQKALFRIYRLVLNRKKVFAVLGKDNKFRKGVFIDELTEIGNYNYFGDNTYINNAIIGNYCSIAPNVIIGPGEHPVDKISTCVRVMEKAGVHINLLKEKVIIENDVWIGANVVILQGVHIGTGSIIAAGAVVTNDVPEYAIVGGVPAKLLKHRFSEQVIALIKKSMWYTLDIKEASEVIKKLEVQCANCKKR